MRSTRMPGEPTAQGQRRFATALVIDLLVILLWWLPITAVVIFALMQRLLM
jgi:hypothetical protein